MNTRKLLEISLDMLIKSQESSVQYIALTTINRIFDIYVYHNLFYPGFYESCYIPLAKRKLSKEKKYQTELKQLANDLNQFLNQNKQSQNKLDNLRNNENGNNNSDNKNDSDNLKLEDKNENTKKNKKFHIFNKFLSKTDYCSCNKTKNDNDLINSQQKLIEQDKNKNKSSAGSLSLANKLKQALFSKHLTCSICENCNKKINNKIKLDDEKIIEMASDK